MVSVGSECYAYKSANGCVETFEDHVLGIIECLEGRWELRGLVKKLSVLYGVNQEVVASLLRLSAILHDIGKTARSIQKECRERFCEEFRYHYVTSARFAIKLGKNSRVLTSKLAEALIYLDQDEPGAKRGYDYFYLTLVVLPVLLHHYAGMREESVLKGLRESGHRLELEIDNACRESIAGLLKYVEAGVPGELRALLDSFRAMLDEGLVELSVIDEEAVKGLLFNYTPSFAKALAEAATGLLNMCDGMVATRNRRCRSP